MLQTMDDCPDYTMSSGLKYSLGFNTVLILQSVFCILTIYVGIKCMRKFRYVYFHPNCKVLVQLLLIGYILHSVAMGFNQLYHVFTYVFLPVCQIAVPTTFCVSFKFVNFSCVFMFSAVHLFLSIERIIAKISVRFYDKMNCWMGVVFAILSALIGISLYLYIIQNDNFGAKKAYCATANKLTLRESTNAMYIQLAMDTTSTTILLVLYVIERTKSGIQHRLGSFNLSAAFQEIELKQATSMLLPLTIFHCALYTLFEVLSITAVLYVRLVHPITFRILLTSFYIFPLYTFLSGLLLLHLMRKFQEEQEKKMKSSVIRITNIESVCTTYAEGWK